MYIPACPLTEANARYLARQREPFFEGKKALPPHFLFPFNPIVHPHRNPTPRFPLRPTRAPPPPPPLPHTNPLPPRPTRHGSFPLFLLFAHARESECDFRFLSRRDLGGGEGG